MKGLLGFNLHQQIPFMFLGAIILGNAIWKKKKEEDPGHEFGQRCILYSSLGDWGDH